MINQKALVKVTFIACLLLLGSCGGSATEEAVSEEATQKETTEPPGNAQIVPTMTDKSIYSEVAYPAEGINILVEIPPFVVFSDNTIKVELYATNQNDQPIVIDGEFFVAINGKDLSFSGFYDYASVELNQPPQFPLTIEPGAKEAFYLYFEDSPIINAVELQGAEFGFRIGEYNYSVEYPQ